jgi:hypothetical protein
MKLLSANEFTKQHEYDEYRKDTKKKDRDFRKQRKEKKQRWSNTIDM